MRVSGPLVVGINVALGRRNAPPRRRVSSSFQCLKLGSKRT